VKKALFNFKNEGEKFESKEFRVLYYVDDNDNIFIVILR
jgi:mRNA-degrading endonuclease RelE of RelBE toxin-antitoxin system